MKHGVAFRKFSRTKSHRDLMLRNLVTSLFEHQRIKTTLPKARDAARLAEKIITMGKKGTAQSHSAAASFLLKPIALTNLFETFSKRYADRPGGYTRVLKLGNRKGDNAPAAVLELVDNPEDLRWEMTARAVAREIVQSKLGNEKLSKVVRDGATAAKEILEKERKLEFREEGGVLRDQTRWNVQKLLRFREPNALDKLSEKAAEHADKLLATPVAMKAMFEAKKEKDFRNFAPRPIAGLKQPGDSRSVLDIAQGGLGYKRDVSPSILTMQKAFRLKTYKH